MFVSLAKIIVSHLYIEKFIVATADLLAIVALFDKKSNITGIFLNPTFMCILFIIILQQTT